MRIRTMLLLGLVVVDLSVVEKAIEVDNALDCVELQAQVQGADKLAPRSETNKYHQWRFCLLCAEQMDVTMVEKGKPSTVYGLCEPCYERKHGSVSGEVVKMRREEIKALVRCKVCKTPLRIIQLHPRFEREQYDTCKSCEIKQKGMAVRRIVCPLCDKVYDYEATDPRKKGEIRLSVCERCEQKEPAKKLSDLEKFKEILKAWEPTPTVESAI